MHLHACVKAEFLEYILSRSRAVGVAVGEPFLNFAAHDDLIHHVIPSGVLRQVVDQLMCGLRHIRGSHSHPMVWLVELQSTHLICLVMRDTSRRVCKQTADMSSHAA